MAQNTGILATAEPTRAATNTPFATLLCLLPKSLLKGHVGQTALQCCTSSFSLPRQYLSSRFAFSLGMKRSTPLSKLSITVPTGHAQPQNTLPNTKIGIRKTRRAISVARRDGNNNSPGGAVLVSTACSPPTGQTSQAPGPM